MKKVHYILFFVLVSSTLFGQVNILNKRTYFTTKALDNEDNSIFIPFAHVFNESLRTSAISDTTGVIKIRANINDTLVITAVGYYPKVIVLNKEQINATEAINTILTRRTYEIQEVSVHALGTYLQFKKKVENLDLPYTKEEKLRADLKEISKSVGVESFEMAKAEMMLTTTPLPKISSAPFSIDLEKTRYNEMLKKEERKAIIYAKFNKIVIKNITELEEPELTDFFVFCNFNEEFLFKATEYEVGEAIKNKFALFLAMMEEKTKDTIAN